MKNLKTKKQGKHKNFKANSAARGKNSSSTAKGKSGGATAKGKNSGATAKSKNSGSTAKGKNSKRFLDNASQVNKVFVGKIDATTRGYGFLLNPQGKDFYIPYEHLGGALHGDTIEAKILSDGSAKVTKIISRGSPFLSGTCTQAGNDVIFSPKNKKFQDFIIKNTKTNANKTDIVILDVNSKTITKSLGSGNEAELKAIIYSYGYEEGFNKTVTAEAKRVSTILPADYNNRKDFRGKTVFTIDGEDSRDFDDAISITKTESGYILCVHIADVSHYVTQGSLLDKQAFLRGTSVYFPYAVIPMLPKELSNGICSLNEGEDRLTLTVSINLSKGGAVKDYKIEKSVINSVARLTYTNAEKIIKGEKNEVEGHKDYAQISSSLKDMASLAKIFIKKREARGAIDFASDEAEIKMDGYKVISLQRKAQLFSHRLIEEFMVLANTLVAKYISKDEPFVYRVHTPPSPEKLLKLTTFLKTIGISCSFLDDEITPKGIAQFLQSVPANLKDVVSSVTLRSMSKAAYEPSCRGHFGLSLKHYCHFTSPIRRYPDLIIHRILKDKLEGKSIKKYGEFVSEASVQSSIKERKAEEAERKADDYLKAAYMANHIGEEYEGYISGVTPWALYVTLPNTVEGQVRVEKLHGRYDYNEDSLTLVGEHVFKLGSKVNVKVTAAYDDKIDLTMLF